MLATCHSVGHFIYTVLAMALCQLSTPALCCDKKQQPTIQGDSFMLSTSCQYDVTATQSTLQYHFSAHVTAMVRGNVAPLLFCLCFLVFLPIPVTMGKRKLITPVIIAQIKRLHKAGLQTRETVTNVGVRVICEKLDEVFQGRRCCQVTVC